MDDFANFGEGIPSFALSGAVGTLKEATCGRRRRFSDLGRSDDELIRGYQGVENGCTGSWIGWLAW